MRNLVFVYAAFAALASCATTPAPIYSAATPYTRPTPPPVGPSIYTSAPHAAVVSTLYACSFNGSNIGELGPQRQSILYTPYIDTPAGPLLRDPTEGACLSSGFGWRGASSGVATGGGREHSGVDLASANGGWIFAAADGRVVSNGWRNGYGLVLEIDHGHGVHTLYGHLNEIDPQLVEGARVSTGEAIARMGATGNATGIHLHYEVIVDDVRVDPLRYGAPHPTWVSQPAPPPPGPVEVDTVNQTFAQPTPIDPAPVVSDAPPADEESGAPVQAAPPVQQAPAADPYASAPYDRYRAQTQSQSTSPYDVYNRMTHR